MLFYITTLQLELVSAQNQFFVTSILIVTSFEVVVHPLIEFTSNFHKDMVYNVNQEADLRTYNIKFLMMLW